MIITIIIGITVLSALVIVHELGHFITAKSTGVRVDEFCLGYPPRLLSIKRGETRFSLNAIPFGGFVRVAGENDPTEPRNLASKGIGARLLFFSAGSLMNGLLALFLFSIAFMVPHNLISESVVVKEVALNSPAAEASIQSGDTFLEINGKPIRNIGDLQRYIQLNLGEEITVLVQHADSTTETLQLTPRWNPPEGQGAIGILLNIDADVLNQTIVKQSYPFWKAIPLGITELIETLVSYKDGLVSMITGKVPATFVGPVGLVQITGEVARVGVNPLFKISALISMLLALSNLLPIPVLDGGRIMFLFIEWIRHGKRVSPRVEGLAHLISFALLIGLLLAITYQDVSRLISGDSLIP